MIISLSPSRSSGFLSLSKEGDTLCVNGLRFDFSQLNEGDYLPREAMQNELFYGSVERKDGKILVPLILPHGADPSEAVRFPQKINVEYDGEILVPSEFEAEVTEAIDIVEAEILWPLAITKEIQIKMDGMLKLAEVEREMSRLKDSADKIISHLQDAVDLDIATEEEVALLRAWKVYRVALSRVPNQVGYHEIIEWPVMPA